MDANSGTPANGAGMTDTPMTDNSPPRPYVQQFSANTAMILQRIKSGVGGLGVGILGNGAPPPPGFEDMKKSVMQGMRTSMNMEIPTPLSAQARRLAKQSPTPGASGSGRSGLGTPPSTYVTPYANKAPGSTPTTSTNGNTGTKRVMRSRGTKRKRVKEESMSAEDSEDLPDLGDDSDSDGSGDIVMPTMTQSGRQIVKPAQFVPSPVGPPSRRRAPSRRTQEERTEQALCKRCGRGHSPQNNMIVFCDGCNGSWHQMCHDPAISDEEVKDETSDWYCADCSQKRGITPAFDATRGISWQGRSPEQKREYLETLSQQQLVALLLHSTTLHPNLPIFPSSPYQARATSSKAPAPNSQQQAFPPSAATSTNLFSRSESNPNAPMNFIRKITSTSNTPSPVSSFAPQLPAPNNKNLANTRPTQASSAPPSLAPSQLIGEEDAEGSRESTPASPPYPKPGMGLMARLGPDDQDEEWLVDQGDFEVFSGVVFGDADADADADVEH